MARARNKRIYSTNREMLVTLREEFIMLGFDTRLDPGMLTIFTLPRRRKRKRKDEKVKEARNKHAEKHARD